ncbi:unnamed protein product [Meloidogyne enterolobii]|uniref:Uncharacterized protein n=1 Tax=Meloidogyne enterolobii TaxID=390850 RepID=A0ACB0XVH4_MELEN
MEISRMRSSLPLEILLYFNARYSTIFYIFLISVFVYKFSLMPYSLHVGICESFIVLLLGPIDFIRIHWARRGNLTETQAFLLLSILLSVASIIGCVYLLYFQAYLMFPEQIAVYAELALVIIGTILVIPTSIFLYNKK